jgi:hypothetical protein
MIPRTRRSWHALVRASFVFAVVALFALPAPSAFAGRLFVSGHDADAHCSAADLPQGQCHFVAVSVGYVRAAAPNPSRPLLLLDCTPQRSLQAAINLGLGPQSATTMCPSKTVGFKNEPLTTDRYSAIIVGSSGDMVNINTTNTTPDSVAVNARAGDISAFFNAGGGVLAFAGDFNADGVDAPQAGEPTLHPHARRFRSGVPGPPPGRSGAVRRHQLLSDAQLLRGAAGQQRAAGRRA